MGWARADMTEHALWVRPGPGLLSRRTTYFENWAIEEVARAFARQELVFQWLTPRMTAGDALVGQVLYRSRGRPLILTNEEAGLLARCDGTRYVTDLIQSQQDGAILRRLVTVGAIHIGLDGPITARPEVRLRDTLSRIPDLAVRTRLTHDLDELIKARSDLAAGAGDADTVLAAWSGFSSVFTRITGSAAVRNAGGAYAGRNLCYEDTVRDVEVRVGASVLAELARPLTLVLDSARWLAAETGERYRRVFTDLLDREKTRMGGEIPAARLLVMATPDLMTGSTRTLCRPVAEAVAEFQQRWCEVLSVPDGTDRYMTTSSGIAERISRLFPPRPAQWSAATQHSPDILLAEQPGNQGMLAVLGELHLAVNTLESRTCVEQHPDSGRLLAMADSDHGDRRIYLLPRSDSPFLTSRTLPPSALLSPRYVYVANDRETADVPVPALPLADLIVDRAGSDLIARSRSSGMRFDFLELIGEVLSGTIVNAFLPLPEARHQPRITIDRLVLCRESWCFPAQEIRWAWHREERERFCMARRWAAEQRIPELVFYRLPGDSKPVAVHFGSPVLVRLFAKAVRGARQVTITEMLPTVNDLWLTDRQGLRYASELRLVAVDSVGRPASASAISQSG
jgi:hypothetical protein